MRLCLPAGGIRAGDSFGSRPSKAFDRSPACFAVCVQKYILLLYIINIQQHTTHTQDKTLGQRQKKAQKDREQRKEQSEDLVRLIGASKQFHK